MNFDKTYHKLLKVPEASLYLGNPIRDDRLEEFFNKLGYILPADFQFFLKKHNGFSVESTEVAGIGKEFKAGSLDQIYQFEHFSTGNPMPAEYLPFSADGYGNYYCLDLSRIESNTCPIVFWQHDFNYSDLSDVETCNRSFMDWIEEVMIEWSKEE